jgi:hypothetical protein
MPENRSNPIRGTRVKGHFDERAFCEALRSPGALFLFRRVVFLLCGKAKRDPGLCINYNELQITIGQRNEREKKKIILGPRKGRQRGDN